MQFQNKIYTLGIVMMLILSIGLTTTGVSADKINPSVAPIEESYQGLTYPDLAIKWWNWTLDIPKDKNPLTENTGERCANGQEGPVWFLGASWSTGFNSITRECTIPSGVALFFPVFNGEGNFLEYSGTECNTIEKLKQCVKAANKEDTLHMYASLDGQEIKSVKENYKVESPPFQITLPANHVLGGTYSGTTTAYQEGWYLLIEPLSEGKHEVIIKVNNGDYVSDVTYKLTVAQKAQNSQNEI